MSGFVATGQCLSLSGTSDLSQFPAFKLGFSSPRPSRMIQHHKFPRLKMLRDVREGGFQSIKEDLEVLVAANCFFRLVVFLLTRAFASMANDVASNPSWHPGSAHHRIDVCSE